MLPEYTTRNRTESREERLIAAIIAKVNLLDQLSEIDLEEVLSDLAENDLVLPKSLRATGNSDIRRLERIDDEIAQRLRSLEHGLTFGGTIQDGSTDPVLARRGELVACDCSTASFVVTLPDPSLAINARAIINVKLVDQVGAFALTVNVAGGGTIDGGAGIALNVANINYTFYVADGEYKVI